MGTDVTVVLCPISILLFGLGLIGSGLSLREKQSYDGYALPKKLCLPNIYDVSQKGMIILQLYNND